MVDKGLTYVPMRFSEPFWARRLQRVHDEFQPDCTLRITHERQRSSRVSSLEHSARAMCGR